MAGIYSVLYVDDEPDLLELGKLLLEENGQFSVSPAESGAIALEMMKHQEFDAIISDYQMPECNGIRLLRHIRHDSDIPFILFTGKGREEVVVEAINSGVDFYLQKGGDTEALFAELGHKISQAISRRSAEKALHRHLDLIRLTSVMATQFIRLSPEQVDEAITKLLAEIGTLAGADRCYLVQEDLDTRYITWTHEWLANGVPSLKEQFNASDPAIFSSTSSRIQAFEIVNVRSVAAMPSEPEVAGKYKAMLQAMGVRSFLLLPLTIGPDVIGSLALDTTRKEVSWQDEDIDILKIYAQIIANALSRKNADVALHESEALYRTVFESTGTAMMILGEDKTVIRANLEMERIFGYSRSEIENRVPWTTFVSPQDLERMKQYHEMRRANPASAPRNYEFGILTRDGRTISAWITVEMIPGTKKSVVSIIDISKERKAKDELADSEEKFRCLTESLAEGIYMIQENRFIYTNPAFARICGYTSEELMALPDFCEIFPEEDRERVRKSVAARLAGEVISEQYTVNGKRKDGTIIPVTIHGSLTRYRGKPAIIGTLVEKNPS